MERDWIDQVVHERAQGVVRALTQAEHAAVNARYPGTTLEMCCECDQPTGRAGRGVDSIYCDACDEGPFCSNCYIVTGAYSFDRTYPTIEDAMKAWRESGGDGE